MGIAFNKLGKLEQNKGNNNADIKLTRKHQFSNSLDGIENAFWVGVEGVHGGLGPARISVH